MLESADPTKSQRFDAHPSGRFHLNSGLTYWKFIIHPHVLRKSRKIWLSGGRFPQTFRASAANPGEKTSEAPVRSGRTQENLTSSLDLNYTSPLHYGSNQT